MPTKQSQPDSPYASQAIIGQASAKKRQAYNSNKNAKVRLALEAEDTVCFKISNDTD